MSQPFWPDLQLRYFVDKRVHLIPIEVRYIFVVKFIEAIPKILRIDYERRGSRLVICNINSIPVNIVLRIRSLQGFNLLPDIKVYNSK